MASINLRGFAALGGYLRSTTHKAARDLSAKIEQFYEARDPKYLEDIFAQANVVQGSSIISDPIIVDGYDTFVLEFEGDATAGSLIVEAVIRPGNPAWHTVATITTGASDPTIQSFSGFYRRIRVNYTHGVGDALTGVNLLIIKS